MRCEIGTSNLHFSIAHRDTQVLNHAGNVGCRDRQCPALAQDFSRLQNFINYEKYKKIVVVVVVVVVVVEEDEDEEEEEELLCSACIHVVNNS
jgi:hypothetical protein